MKQCLKKYFILEAFLFIGSFFIISCQKDDELNKDLNSQGTEQKLIMKRVQESELLTNQML